MAEPKILTTHTESFKYRVRILSQEFLVKGLKNFFKKQVVREVKFGKKPNKKKLPTSFRLTVSYKYKYKYGVLKRFWKNIF